jgi:hypothetical protein
MLVALLALLAFGVVRWMRDIAARTRVPGTLEDRLRAHLPYLDVDDAVLAAFARDQRAGTGAREEIDAIAARFLLSTDFFQNGADEDRPLRYVAYYDPYRSPCYNPLRDSAEGSA